MYFVIELISFPMAVAVIIIFWLRPTWVLSEAAARREVDMMQRRERARFNYGTLPEDGEERRRMEERAFARFPRYEDLDIEEVILDKSQD